MKITIDTSIDHPDDIRKAIQLLAHLANKQGKSIYSNTNVNPYSEPATNTNSYSNPSAAPTPEPDKSPDFSNFMNLMDNAPKKEEEKKKEIPQIMTF